MMRSTKQLLTTTVFLLILEFTANGQYNIDSFKLVQQVRLNGVWHHAQGVQSGIYSGREYMDYTRLLKEGHPYFDTSLALASIDYSGVVYEQVPVLLDLIKEELIAQHANKVFLVQLVKSKITSFSFNGHFFEHLGRDSLRNKTGLSDGFYDRVYDGQKARFYVRRQKTIQEVIENLQVNKLVRNADRYYIFKDDQYHSVRTKASVTKLLGHKKQLSQALRHNNVKFKKNRERAIHLMVQTFDSL